MITMILSVALLALYLLGVSLMKELVDTLEENDQEFMTRPHPYWTFILTWPYQVVRGLMEGDEYNGE